MKVLNNDQKYYLEQCQKAAGNWPEVCIKLVGPSGQSNYLTLNTNSLKSFLLFCLDHDAEMTKQALSQFNLNRGE